MSDISRKLLTIQGDNFSDMESFYHEIDRVFTKNLSWKTGHNLDAFNDILAGGFGVYEYGEPVKIIWSKFLESKKRLGDETVEDLLQIIKSHPHIDFVMEE